jgi:hypothetical protein
MAATANWQCIDGILTASIIDENSTTPVSKSGASRVIVIPWTSKHRARGLDLIYDGEGSLARLSVPSNFQEYNA